MRAGLFDGAEIAISFVNWEDPDGHGEIKRCSEARYTMRPPKFLGTLIRQHCDTMPV